MFLVLNKEKISAYIVSISTVAILLMISVTIPTTKNSNTIQTASNTYNEIVNESIGDNKK